MKTTAGMALWMLASASLAYPQTQCAGAKDAPVRKMKMSMQCWTFNKFSFLETLDRTKALGIRFIEAYPGQLLGGDWPGAGFSHDMTDAQAEWVKKQLDDRNLKLAAYGVVQFDNTEESMRPVFAFAKKMGIEVINTEPGFDDYSLIEKMVREYDVKVAVHNHAVPNKYALPQTVLDHVKGLDARIGGGPDTGHWMRSGVSPVEGLRLLEGRIVHLHLKDLNKFGAKDAKDVPFGSGKADIKGILAELSRQNYDGTISIEHENPDENMNPSPSIRKGLDYIKSVTTFWDYQELLSRSGGKYGLHGWNHYGPGYFTLDEKTGELTGYGGMGLLWYSARKFADFILELDYRCDDLATNSGIFLRIPELVSGDGYIYKSFEVQIDDSQKGKWTTGGVFDAEAPSALAYHETGLWNHYQITNQGKRITVELNGKTVTDWEAEPRGKIRECFPEGYIGLQNHDSRALIHFKNIFIKEL
jgi:sugar phosphate isomerase/epimerase